MDEQQAPQVAQTNNTEENNFEPTHIRLATVVFRTLSGVAGGIAGSAIMFLLFLLAESGTQNLFSSEAGDTFNPMLMFTVLAIAFLCTQASAIISSALFSLCQRDKYERVTATLIHVFILNLIFFVLLAPIYVIVVSVVPHEFWQDYIVYVIAMHVFLSTLSSTMVMEIIAEYRYAILGVYSVSLAVLSSILIIFFINEATVQLTTLLLILPICWAMAGLIVGIIEMIYWWMFDVYGVDYLNLATEFSSELGLNEDEDEEEILPGVQ